MTFDHAKISAQNQKEQSLGSINSSNPYARYILGFIGFISLLIMLLAAILWREQKRDIDLFTQITEYHLISQQKLERVEIEVALLESAMLVDKARQNPVVEQNPMTENGEPLPFAHKVDTTMYAVDQFMVSLRSIQDRFNGPTFSPAFDRLEASVNELSETALRLGQAGARQPAEFARPIESLKFRVAQLDRLHSAAYRDLLVTITQNRVSERQNLAIIAGAMVLAVVVIAYLTIRRVDGLAKEQENTELMLASALSRAEKANAAKTDFLTHMSHDLRTPLNSILGFSQMMKVHTFGPLGNAHYEEYARLIHHSGERLVSMVNDVLDFARIESGEYRIENVEIDILDQAKNCLQRCVAMPFDDLNNRFGVVIAKGAPTLCSDERAVSQILDNLVSNALKYAGDSASISIEWSVNQQGKGVLQVKDTGRGIPKRQLEKVMEPFVQGGTLVQSNPHIARTGEGVGLGLHIVTKLAAILSAEFSLTSVEGKGTTTSIIFPANKLN